MRDVFFTVLAFVHYHETSPLFLYHHLIYFFFELNFPFLCKKNWLGSKSSINYLFCVRSLFLFALHAFKEDIKAKLLNFVQKKYRRDRKRARRPNGTPRRNIDFVFLKSANQFWLSIISF